MTAGLVLALVLSLSSAFALNWGFVVQHGAAAVMPPLRVRRPLASLRLLFANARWLAGFLVYERRLDLPRVGLAALAAEAYLPFQAARR